MKWVYVLFFVVIAVTKISERATSQVERFMLAQVLKGSHDVVAWQNIGMVGACGMFYSWQTGCKEKECRKRLGKDVVSRTMFPVAYCCQSGSTSPLLCPN